MYTEDYFKIYLGVWTHSKIFLYSEVTPCKDETKYIFNLLGIFIIAELKNYKKCRYFLLG